MTMNSCSAIFRAFTKDRETAVDHKIKAIEKQLSVITKLHAKDMKEMKALIESISEASVENLKVDSSIKEEINEIKEEDKKELAFMIANVEKELKDARDELEKLQSTPKLGSENMVPIDVDAPDEAKVVPAISNGVDAAAPNADDRPDYSAPAPALRPAMASEVVKAGDTQFDSAQLRLDLRRGHQ